MTRDDSGDRLLRRVALMSALDGTRPSGTLEWVSPVIPVVTQAAVGAGHWAAGRRQRALAAWASAAGFALVVWGLPRAVQRRRPRIAAGSALVAAGAVARLRAASAEPLR